MKKQLNEFKVLKNKQLNIDYFQLDLLLNEDFETSKNNFNEILPGQFVQISIPNNVCFLRRPISIFDVDVENRVIKIIIKIVGNGTNELSKLIEGEIINLIYPLGNNFSLPKKTENNNLLFIGGGVGIAPLYYAAKCFTQKNYVADFILGFKTKEEIVLHKNFQQLGNVHITTDDGSFGEKGRALNHSLLKNKKFSKIFACGPKPMLNGVIEYAHKNYTECEISLENLMACGIGACLCCITKTKDGNKCICKEGPVFDVNNFSVL